MSTIPAPADFDGFPQGPKTYLWTSETMPDPQPHQIAATTEEKAAPGFDPARNRIAHIQWYQPPAEANRGDACMVIISGGGYDTCCDIPSFAHFVPQLLAAGLHCVNLTYRTPRAKGIPLYQTAWEDVQRGIRMIRSQAAEHGFSPDKIGVAGCSAGSHLCMLLALSSRTPAYAPVDALDEVPVRLAWSIPMCPAYVLADGLASPNGPHSHAPDVAIDPVFAFDDHSCPCCFMHGGNDPYSPYASIKAYRRLREMGLPAELHLEAYAPHGFINYTRLLPGPIILDFLRRIGILAPALPRSGHSTDDDLAATVEWQRQALRGIQTDLHLPA